MHRRITPRHHRFKYRVFARLLRKLHAFEVRRAGVPVSTIRTAIERLGQGRIVGICPEGGVMRGTESCVRGGDIKRGVGLISPAIIVDR